MNAASRFSAAVFLALAGLAAGCTASAPPAEAASSEQNLSQGTVLYGMFDPSFEITIALPSPDRIEATARREMESYSSTCSLEGTVEAGHEEALLSCVGWAFTFEIAVGRSGSAETYELRSAFGSGVTALGDPNGPLIASGGTGGIGSVVRGIFDAAAPLLGEEIINHEVHVPTPIRAVQFRVDGTRSLSATLPLGFDGANAYIFGAPLRDARGNFVDAGDLHASLRAAIQ